jgi:hypothetical protein
VTKQVKDVGAANDFAEVAMSRPEASRWHLVRPLGRLSSPPSGIPEGKYLTTTAELAVAWGKLMVSCKWEVTVGQILEVRLAAATAEAVHYVGVIDGIGACYFATFDELNGAVITEVTT